MKNKRVRICIEEVRENVTNIEMRGEVIKLHALLLASLHNLWEGNPELRDAIKGSTLSAIATGAIFSEDSSENLAEADGGENNGI